MSAKKFAPVPSGGTPLELGLVAVHGNFGRPGDIPMDLPVIPSPLFLNVHVNNMRHQGERISTPRMPISLKESDDIIKTTKLITGNQQGSS